MKNTMTTRISYKGITQCVQEQYLTHFWPWLFFNVQTVLTISISFKQKVVHHPAPPDRSIGCKNQNFSDPTVKGKSSKLFVWHILMATYCITANELCHISLLLCIIANMEMLITLRGVFKIRFLFQDRARSQNIRN